MRLSCVSLLATVSASTVAFAQNPVIPPVTGGPNQVIREYFDQSQPGQNWTLYSQVPGDSFRWQLAGEQPGFHYYNHGHGYGYTTWNIGTQPFDLKFDVTLAVSVLHEYVRNGVLVALSTAAPDKQGPNDISAVMAIQGAGPGASVRKGPLFLKDTELSNLTRWPLAGDVESIAWPNGRLAGTQVTVEMQRLAGNVLVFSIFRPDFKDGQQPWWTRSWTMPANIAGTAFNTLIVQTLNTDPTANVPQLSYTYQGVVSNIRGYVPSAELPPTVLSAAPVSQTLYQTGAAVTVNGQGFQPGATVWLGNQYLTTTFISSTQLSIVLPTLPPGTYQLKVINPTGLEWQLPVGITYSGPTVLRVDPREASPIGGDLVTLVGAGFDSNTQVTIGGQAAPVVQVVDSFHLQVQVPGGPSGAATVRVQGSNGAAFAGSPIFGYAPHPYLHYSSNGLPTLQQKFVDPQFADYRTILLRNATDADPNNPKGAVADYLWPYLMTGNTTYRTSLFNRISQEIDRIDFTDFRLTDASLMATAYDTLFPELTPQQRVSFLAYLDRALTVYNQMRADNAWFLGPSGNNISNTTSVSNSSGAQIALALQNSTPGTALVVNDAVKRILPYITRCIAPDGGNVEGPLYWNYGLTWYLQLGHVLKTVTGDDRSLLSQPNLLKSYRFVESTFGGDARYATFNDSEPQLYGMAITADLGTRLNQPLMLWMSDYLAHQNADPSQVEDEASRYDIAPYAFLWRGSTTAPATFPGLPTSSVLQNMNWGILRSGPELQPNLVVALKGGSGDLTHHAQKDVGSFVLQAGGEQFFLDPGYFQPAANRHSLPLIDGVGPTITGSTIDSLFDSGGVRTMVLDSTQAYGGKAQRVRRIVVLYADQAAVLVDDIVPAANQPGLVTSQFQTGYPTTATNSGFLVQGQQTQIQAVFNGPPVRVFTSGPLDFGGSWVFKAQNVQWYSTTATYTADPNVPLVTVFLPARVGGAGLNATATWKPGQTSVTFSDGRTLAFTLGPNGWKF